MEKLKAFSLRFSQSNLSEVYALSCFYVLKYLFDIQEASLIPHMCSCWSWRKMCWTVGWKYSNIKTLVVYVDQIRRERKLKLLLVLQGNIIFLPCDKVKDFGGSIYSVFQVFGKQKSLCCRTLDNTHSFHYIRPSVQCTSNRSVVSRRQQR